jgi:hypothetical protein
MVKVRHDRLAYNVTRKNAFLAISNLNASFQRLTQDPKSKQKEFQLIYEIVTLNQTMISAIASIGTFIANHKTTSVSNEFDILSDKISNTLQLSYSILDTGESADDMDEIHSESAQEKLLARYHDLSNKRDNNIQKGNSELDKETLQKLQEAYLIANHMSWLKSLSDNLKKSISKYLNTSLE